VTNAYAMPAVQNPAAYGCGDYFDWITYEAVQRAREQRRELDERRLGYVDIPVCVQPETPPPMLSTRSTHAMERIGIQFTGVILEAESTSQFFVRSARHAVTTPISRGAGRADRQTTE